MCKKFVKAKLRLGLSIFYSSIYTNPRVLQRFVQPVVADMAHNIANKSTKKTSFPNGWPYRTRYSERLVRRDNSLITHISTYGQLSKRLLQYQTYYYITYEQALKNRSTNFWRKNICLGGVWLSQKSLDEKYLPNPWRQFRWSNTTKYLTKNVGWHFSSSFFLASSSISEIAVTDWVH
jgi:hypothetical protein